MQSFSRQSKDLLEFTESSEFIYSTIQPIRAKVIGLFKEGVKTDILDDEGEVVFDKTNFYATSGGQIADTGAIENETCSAIVVDVNKTAHKQHLHSVKVQFGSIRAGDEFTLIVDAERRKSIMRNHSAAHLLQKALRVVLGDHVHQEGSYVSDTMVRFDFPHYEKMTALQLRQVEKTVNEYISRGMDVETKVLPLAEAKKLDAMALFDEKYGDYVRVVDMGGESVEFCGGTHVANTKEIGLFAIVYEESIAAGVRRIEGRCSLSAYELLKQKEIALRNVADQLKCSSYGEVPLKIRQMNEEIALLRKSNAELSRKLSGLESKAMREEFREFCGIRVLLKKVVGYDKERFTALFDSLKGCYDPSIVLLANAVEDRVQFIASVSPSLTERYSAGNLIRTVTHVCGGSGGGRKEFAQGGGKDVGQIEKAFDIVRKEICE